VRAALVVAVVVVVPAFAGGCPKSLDCGGLSSEPPADLADGKAKAVRSDNAAFDEDATWAPGSNASVDMGGLDLTVAKDETGTPFDDLVGDGAFPICVPLASRSDTTGVANLLASPHSFLSDATHTGNVALLQLDGDLLLGRFAVDMVSSDGAQTLSFTDGAFSARRR
jgi:hypothetical protein